MNERKIGDLAHFGQYGLPYAFRTQRAHQGIWYGCFLGVSTGIEHQYLGASLPVGSPHKVSTVETSNRGAVCYCCRRLIPEGVARLVETAAQVMDLHTGG